MTGRPAVAIAVVAYEAEEHISDLLDRIPDTVGGEAPLILVSDDASSDRTTERAEKWAAARGDGKTQVRRQPRNLGYGGNQKAVFAWAAEEGADIAVLLHGDEQYPPEMIEDLVEPLVAGDASAVFGSRMMIPGGARRGGMPMTRFLANKGLTRILNVLAPATLTEWFTGFRAYRIPVLTDLDYERLPDGFDFDLAITARLLRHGHRIAEVPIPTHYGDELSRVPLVRTGFATLRHGVGAGLSRVPQWRRAGARTSDRGPGALQRYWSSALAMEPAHELALGRERRGLRRMQSVAVFAALDLNGRLIDRFAGDPPRRWSSRSWAWMQAVEASTDEIRTELERYLEAQDIPESAELYGPDQNGARAPAGGPAPDGAVRSLFLAANGRWIVGTARHFPHTVALMRQGHPLTNVGFGVLGPHGHIASHVDPNRGALRFQLPIVVPGAPGDCRIRIGDDVVVWKEGEAVVFDLGLDHEVWNDSDGTRILLMAEIEQPLAFPLNVLNRGAQYGYRFFPPNRKLPSRVARADRERR